MKAVIFSPYFYPHRGGLEQFSWELSTRMAKFGHTIIVVSSKIGPEKHIEHIDGIRIVRLDTYDLMGSTFPIPKFNNTNKKLLQGIFSEKIDTVITNTRFFPLTLCGVWLAKKHKIKSFHIEHGTCLPNLPNSFKRFIAYLYDQIFGKLVFKLTDKCLAISKASADFSETLGGKNVEIIYNAVDTDFFRSSPATGTSDGITRIIFVGRLVKAKGVQDLICALGNIQTDKLRLSIVGTGNYEKELKALAKNDDRIIFIGQKNKGEIRNLLNESDIFINPSYSEGLPTSVLEAGAMELTIIATDVGGTKEIIEDNINGFLVQPHQPIEISEKIKIILEGNKTVKSVRRNIRQTVLDKFSWNKNVNKFIDYLEKERQT